MIQQTLSDFFGHPAFRDGQEPVIRALLDGLTLEISPLILLIKDQVNALAARAVAAATPKVAWKPAAPTMACHFPGSNAPHFH